VTSPAKSPSPKEVGEFHRNSDKDTSDSALHHSLGLSAGQAARGAHDHNGQNSPLLWDGITITGSRSGATASVLQQILIALSAKGITDATTP